mgnify:CR=1 FL=1
MVAPKPNILLNMHKAIDLSKCSFQNIYVGDPTHTIKQYPLKHRPRASWSQRVSVCSEWHSKVFELNKRGGLTLIKYVYPYTKKRIGFKYLGYDQPMVDTVKERVIGDC